MNRKFAEEIENLEVKNLKYWSSYYAKEGNFVLLYKLPHNF
jgi:hypothetical protein